MKRSVKVLIFLLIVLILFFLIFLIYFLINNKIINFSPPESELNPEGDGSGGVEIIALPIAQDCSDAAIKSVWDQVFYESSNGITIITNNSDQSKCESYMAYKIIENETYMLLTVLKGNNSITIKASNSNSITEHLLILGSITNIENISLFDNEILANPELSSFPRNISSEEDAYLDYNSKFKIKNSTNFQLSSSEQGLVYISLISNYSNNITLNSMQIVFIKNGTTKMFISQIDNRPITYNIPCIPNWIPQNSSCMSNDTKITDYEDFNICNNNSSKPSPIIYYCDYDGNGIIGKEINLNGIGLNVSIEGSIINYSLSYNGTKRIEFKEGNITRVSLLYNFSQPLNFYNYEIIEQPSSSKLGYFIVKGIEGNKNITFDRKNGSTQVCIEDSPDIDSISSISSKCASANEYLISCPGTNSSFSCTLTETTFTISGLKHSAAKEFFPPSSTPSGNPNNANNPNEPACTSNWECGDWEPCLNNQRIKSCIDLNECNTNQLYKEETEACVSSSTLPQKSCTPDWNCTSWQPSECPENQTRLRICTDLNTCNVNDKKPAEKQTCNYQSLNLLIIVIIILSVLIITILVLLFYLIKKGKPKEELTKGVESRWPPQQA
ncbi:MAG: hypothetical protein Q7S74_03585 [Nanoarchaeota archaeon]|nr:hypothetical protein [Nanoarchaeota archaeon]